MNGDQKITSSRTSTPFWSATPTAIVPSSPHHGDDDDA